TFVHGSMKYPAHKSLLASRYPYFDKLFSGAFSDCGKSEILVTFCRVSVFELFLQYVYTNNISFKNVPLEEIMELEGVARLLEDSTLEGACCYKIVGFLSENTVYSILQHAYRTSNTR